MKTDKEIQFWKGAVELYAQRTAPEFQIQLNPKEANKKWKSNKER